MTWENRTNVSSNWDNRIDWIIRDETSDPILDENWDMLIDEDRIRYENRTNVWYNGYYPYTANWKNRQ